MAGRKLTVVISQSQGKNPVKRHLEEGLAAALLTEPNLDVSLVPHLYDLSSEHTGMLFLRSVGGDMVVLAWLYPRATRWILDRNGVKGREGRVLIERPDDETDAEESDQPPATGGIGAVDVPNRRIYCIDLRDDEPPGVYLDEIRRIAREQQVQTVSLGAPPGGNGRGELLQFIQGRPKPEQLQRYLQDPAARAGSLSDDPRAESVSDRSEPARAGGNGGWPADEESVRRRWYPVIDYDRCTNCMECIDFCLFGVYGVDHLDRILVEQQDNCKKGCPACSRVCPENAIIFPGHKTPAIAGADGEVAGLKIDLSKLFGAPGKSALELAVAERDTELIKAGREAVGMSVGIPKRQAARKDQPRDELDELMDGLDALEL